jgi:hypothetical protein
MLKNIKYILGSIWLAVVIFFYYKNHSYYLNESSILNFSGLGRYWQIWLAPLMIYGAFLFSNWFNEKPAIFVRINYKKILAFFFLSMLFVANIAYWMKPMMYTGPKASISQNGEVFFEPDQTTIQSNPYYFIPGITISNEFNFYEMAPESIRAHIIKPSFWQMETGFVWTFIKVYGTSLLFLLFALNLGNALLKKVHSEENFESKILDMVLGLGASTIILLGFAMLGQFKLIFIIPTFVTITILLRKNLFGILKEVRSFDAEYEFKYSNFVIPAFLIFWTFLCLNFFDNLSPMPRGWDGLNRYILVARDIAESHAAVKIGSVYAWEMILAFFYAIDSKIALFWTSLPAAFSLLLIYLLCRKFTSRTSSLLVITAMIAMPLMVFYLADENKVDPAHWMFGTASVIAFLNYSKNPRSIYLAALLAGFAFTVKFTSVFIIFALITGFAFVEGGILGFLIALFLSLTVLIVQGGFNLGTEFISSTGFNQKFAIISSVLSTVALAFALLKKKIHKNSLKKLGVVILFVLIPISPWLAKNFSETYSLSSHSLLFGENEILLVDFENDTKSCDTSAFYEEYDRYLGYNTNIISRVLEVPWHLTMNDTGARGAYVDIGFAFLGFALLAILFAKNLRKNAVLIIFGFSLTLFWLLKSYGVIWYAFTILSFLALALAICFETIKKDRFGKIILGIFLLLWISSAMSVKLLNFGNAALIMSHTNTVTYQNVQDAIFPYANEMEDFLKTNDGYVYKVGTPLGFYIPNVNIRSFNDQLLDTFSCIYTTQDQDFTKVATKLRENNFKYILYDSYTKTVGLDPKGTLAGKVALMEEFLINYGIPVIYDDVRGYHLYYIPTPEELAEYKSQ